MGEQFIYGMHAVCALLANPHRVINTLFVNQDRADKRLQELLDKAAQAQISIEKLSAQKMNQRFADFAHQGVVASASSLPDYAELDLIPLLESSKTPSLILILDGITDPHNLGACLRCADATGVDFIVIPLIHSRHDKPLGIRHCTVFGVNRYKAQVIIKKSGLIG